MKEKNKITEVILSCYRVNILYITKNLPNSYLKKQVLLHYNSLFRKEIE